MANEASVDGRWNDPGTQRAVVDLYVALSAGGMVRERIDAASEIIVSARARGIPADMLGAAVSLGPFPDTPSALLGALICSAARADTFVIDSETTLGEDLVEDAFCSCVFVPYRARVGREERAHVTEMTRRLVESSATGTATDCILPAFFAQVDGQPVDGLARSWAERGGSPKVNLRWRRWSAMMWRWTLVSLVAAAAGGLLLACVARFGSSLAGNDVDEFFNSAFTSLLTTAAALFVPAWMKGKSLLWIRGGRFSGPSPPKVVRAVVAVALGALCAACMFAVAVVATDMSVADVGFPDVVSGAFFTVDQIAMLFVGHPLQQRWWGGGKAALSDTGAIPQ